MTMLRLAVKYILIGDILIGLIRRRGAVNSLATVAAPCTPKLFSVTFLEILKVSRALDVVELPIQQY